MATARTLRRPAATTPLAAVIGLFALLIQALLPAAALAGQSPSRGETMVICTAQGTMTVTVGAEADGSAAKGFAGLPCVDCLAVTIAATTPPDVSVAPVIYVAARVEHAPDTADLSIRAARAPPRPPGQGPPLPNA